MTKKTPAQLDREIAEMTSTKLTPAQRNLLGLIAHLHARRGGRAALVSKSDKSLTPRALRALASKGLLLIGSAHAADVTLIEVRLTDAGRAAARS